ncbi:group 1 glycosyl transferase [Salinisphaera shabanensis T35B1]|uniref:glycosyltransferase n=1 Tax=Salinisphaera shabanensis TaxID=180542 RepID=UPI0033409778
MHIIQIIPTYSGGGAEILARELHRGMLERDQESSIIFFCANPRREKPGVRGEHFLGFQNPRSPGIALSLRRVIRRIITKQQGPFVLHLHLTWGLFYGVVASAGLDIPTIYTIHNTADRHQKYAGAKLLFSTFFKRVDRLVAISESDSRNSFPTWLSIPSNKITVIPNGARLFSDIKFEGAATSSAKLVVVAVGSLIHRKGFDSLIEGIGTTTDIVESATIVGEGPDREALEDQISRHSMKQVITLAGWQENIAHFYARANVAVISSRWEAFGLVAIEALSTGLPLVSAEVPGLKNVLSGCESVFWYRSGSPTELAKALERVHDARRAGTDFSKSSKNFAANFGMGAMVSKYAELYDRALVQN